MSGIYWGLTALHLLGHPEALPRQGVLDFVFSCLHDNGGFGAAPGHDPHMLYTVSAVQILVTLNALDDLERRVEHGKEKIGRCMPQCDIIASGRHGLTADRYRRTTGSRHRYLCRR